MENIQHLEEKYLKAKIAYYDGTSFLTDLEFDTLEEHLKNKGSKVIEQVGSKRKDFDFPHPTKMLSLDKIQSEAIVDGTDYKTEEFYKWYNKCAAIVGPSTLYSSPKFDGNAINIIYRCNTLSNILTRGDGFAGKDVTDRLKPKLPLVIETSTLLKLKDTDVLEIRCEAVININIFNEKYATDFANARNYVAGVLSKDDYNEEKVNELTLIPIHYILNGKHIEPHYFSLNHIFYNNYLQYFKDNEYEKTIKLYEELRSKFDYQLDGVVLSFNEQYREKLGVTSKVPEWGIAIKFVPMEVSTTVEGIEWNVSKRGELAPVVLLKPVFLDGSTVKRASVYNAGYVIDNKLAKDAVVSVAKKGDIIPAIQSVIVPSINLVELPSNCPTCNSKTEFDGIHLMCTNIDCVGKIIKQLASAVKILKLKDIGEKTIEPFAKDFKNMYELIKWVRLEGNTVSGNIDQYGIKYGSRSHEIFLKAFNNIKSLTYAQIIQILGYENVGDKLSIQLAREHAGLDFDYSNLEKALVAKLRSEEESNFIKEVVNGLENLGIKVDRPQIKIKNDMEKTIYVCLTGSPKSAGYKTKEEFMAAFPSLVETSLTDSKCNFLITDSYNSTSSKMKVATKKEIEIKTYEDFKI